MRKHSQIKKVYRKKSAEVIVDTETGLVNTKSKRGDSPTEVSKD